jgi:hypothetical protein
MSAPTLIKQTWWPEDTDAQRDAKLQRLHATVLAQRDFPIEVVVKRHQKKRTPEANNYLWGVVYPLMSDASGEEKEEIHFAMCCKYFGEKVIEVMGERYRRPRRTTTTNDEGEAEWLSPGEFAEFVDFTIREAAFWYDVAVPPPTPKEVPRE